MSIKLFFEILDGFPKSKNWKSFLKLKNGKKLFFDLFIKKYWLSWKCNKYSKKDVLRRIRMVEFFDYITSNYEVLHWEKDRYIIETNFYRMVMVKTKNNKLELLSFYNFR